MTATPHHDRGTSVLIVGRSPSVLEDAVAMLRSRGISAGATNDYDRALDGGGPTPDVLVLGGAVPPATKELLTAELQRRNPAARVLLGLVGIAEVVAAQVEAEVEGTPSSQVAYDAAEGAVVIDLDRSAHVAVDAFWATSLTPPQPTSTGTQVLAADLAPGRHRVPLPDGLPDSAAFAVVRVDDRVAVLTLAAVPDLQLAPGALPPVRPVTLRAGSLS
ncbi:hypothetical protein [Cellulomonas alba]|uniref:Response regulatory domain-containing protein n=1 Tax=Cellulomonas alba TaxID=3053467 RepID=A0ABT7SCE5_9CELL|nr:hypothetical protein [Cellulomonas alba]MDM7853850.1 hypothetical protein [Cellulomonas alba]